MKKYHQSPTFGVRSGNNRCTPYVDARNSHDPPVMRYDSPSSPATAPVNTPVIFVAYALSDEDPVVFAESNESRIIGGRSRIGYRDR